MKAVAGEISAFDSAKIAELEKAGKLEVAGHEITADDVEIFTKDIPGWTVASEGKTTVALDLTLTDELKSEGIAREFINRVQNIRKENNFELTDRISIEIEENGPFTNEILKNQEYISSEVLSDKIKVVFSLANFQAIEIEEQTFNINVERIEKQ